MNKYIWIEINWKYFSLLTISLLSQRQNLVTFKPSAESQFKQIWCYYQNYISSLSCVLSISFYHCLPRRMLAPKWFSPLYKELWYILPRLLSRFFCTAVEIQRELFCGFQHSTRAKPQSFEYAEISILWFSDNRYRELFVIT